MGEYAITLDLPGDGDLPETIIAGSGAVARGMGNGETLIVTPDGERFVVGKTPDGGVRVRLFNPRHYWAASELGTDEMNGGPSDERIHRCLDRLLAQFRARHIAKEFSGGTSSCRIILEADNATEIKATP